MSIKTITKIVCFVIPLVLTAGCSGVSHGGAEHARIDRENTGFHKPDVIAHISSKKINESSGLAVSKCQPDVFWTHNDSGGGPFMYAFDSKGELLGTFRLPNVKNIDWEDMSSTRTSDGGCFLFIGEFGDNDRKRDVHAIYRVTEPLVAREGNADEPAEISSADQLTFRYPAERHDAEALLVNSLTGILYVITKASDGPAHVYRLNPSFGSEEVQLALKIAEITLPASPSGFVTGGDISDDGTRVALCDYYAGYELQLPAAAEEFDEIWQQKPAAFDLGPRVIGESIAYSGDGNTLFATTERVNAPLIRVIRK
jgi:hypothetical protein